MKSHFDVVIVGGGGSGLTAAVSAAEHGCSVIVLEKQRAPGGTTAIAVGSFTASRTELQQRAGIEDSPEAHAEDVARFAPPEIEARNNEELRRFFLQHAAETLSWLQGMGISFFGPSPEPPNRVPRMHNVVPAARAYILALQKRFLKLGGQITCDAPVETLLRDATGRITGVRARVDGREVDFHASRGVVLAAGDYANSRELIAEFKGSRYSAIEGINRNAGGDGQNLARSVGAPLINMDVTYGPEIRFIPQAKSTFQQRLPAAGPLARFMGNMMPFLPSFILNGLIKRLLVSWQHPENALFSSGAILLNSRGERFCNELHFPEREIAIADQPMGQAYLLLDERLCRQYSEWPHFISTAPRIAYAYVADYLRLRPDVAVAGSSIHEIATKRYLPVEVVERTVARYNDSARARQTDQFGRDDERQPLRGNRWVLLGPAKSYFTTTEGGPAITTRFEVLDADRQPIPGLFAVGQNGIGGQVLWGHGLKIGWALTSGRLIGRVLATLPAPQPGPAETCELPR